MVRNSLSPGYVRLYYSTVVASLPMEHRMTLPVIPSPGALGGWELFQRNLSLVNWNTAVDTLLTAMKFHWHTSTSFSRAELWTMADEDSEPVFQEDYAFTVAGTGATATTIAAQGVYSFRTTNNGRAKFTMLEPSTTPNVRQNYAAISAGQKTFVDFLKGATCWIIGRDGGNLNSFIYFTTKTNDALRRHRMNL